MPPADTRTQLQHRETLCLDVLLSGLDAHGSAQRAASPMLIYLAEILIRRARDELATIRNELDRLDQATSKGASAP